MVQRILQIRVRLCNKSYPICSSENNPKKTELGKNTSKQISYIFINHPYRWALCLISQLKSSFHQVLERSKILSLKVIFPLVLSRLYGLPTANLQDILKRNCVEMGQRTPLLPFLPGGGEVGDNLVSPFGCALASCLPSSASSHLQTHGGKTKRLHSAVFAQTISLPEVKKTNKQIPFSPPRAQKHRLSFLITFFFFSPQCRFNDTVCEPSTCSLVGMDFCVCPHENPLYQIPATVHGCPAAILLRGLSALVNWKRAQPAAPWLASSWLAVCRTVSQQDCFVCLLVCVCVCEISPCLYSVFHLNSCLLHIWIT